MAGPATFAVFRERVLFSVNGDLHDQNILQENGMAKSQGIQGVDTVLVQLAPDGMRYDEPFEKWKFIIDYDCCGKPPWFNEQFAEAECRRLLPQWAKYHIITEGTAVCGPGETRIALGSARIQQTGGEVWAYNYAKVEQLHYFGLAYAYDDSQVTARAHVEAHDRAHIVLKGGILFTDPERGIRKPQISLQVKVHSPDVTLTWQCNKSSAFVDDRELRMRRMPQEARTLRPMGECP